MVYILELEWAYGTDVMVAQGKNRCDKYIDV